MKRTTGKSIIQERRLLYFLAPLMKVGLPSTKNEVTPLAKNVFLRMWVTAATSTTDAAIFEKDYGSDMTALVISSNKIKHIMKIVKILEELGSLIKGVSETITTQKVKFSIKDLFSKCEKIRGFLPICSHSLKKSLMKNFIFLWSELKMK